MGPTQTTITPKAAGRWGRAAGILVVLMVAGGAAAACSSTAADPVAAKPSCGGSAPELTVQGTGLTSGTPDILTISVGINVTDPTAQSALSDDNGKATAVTTALTNGGVATKDIQTTDVSINPQYNIHGVITGYQVSNTLTAILRNFTTAGSVIDAVAGAGGNATRLESLNFSVEDTRTLEDTARTDAVHQAVSHAKSMAVSAGERLGPVCSLKDQSQTENYNQSYGNLALPEASASKDSVVPLEPGSQQETAQVTMVYSLLPPKATASTSKSPKGSQ